MSTWADVGHFVHSLSWVFCILLGLFVLLLIIWAHNWYYARKWKKEGKKIPPEVPNFMKK